MTFSCSVKVVSTEPQDFGGVATLEFVQPSVGIDISPEGPFKLHYGSDAGELIVPGAELVLSVGSK